MNEPADLPGERSALQLAVDEWWKTRELIGTHVRAQLLTVERIELAERGELGTMGPRSIVVDETHTWQAGAP